MAERSARLLWLDVIRAACAQLIVLHHLAVYGPISERIARDWAGAVDWFADYARLVVQVFLVMSGFLFGWGLDHLRISRAKDALVALGRRYVRLFIPFLFAITCASLASIPARLWVGDADWISESPDLWVVLAHLTGLFDYLAIEALTAGAWYVSIDFQIHLIVLLTLWACHRFTGERAQAERVWWLLVLGLALLSFFVINRDPRWDITPFYFFGSFAQGLAAERLSRGRAALSCVQYRVSVAILLSAGVSLALESAIRPGIALVSALLILALARGAGDWLDSGLYRLPGGAFLDRVMVSLGRSAYALFLIHFPLAILLNALFVRFLPDHFLIALGAALIAWLGAVPVALAVYRWVERPIERWIRRT